MHFLTVMRPLCCTLCFLLSMIAPARAGDAIETIAGTGQPGDNGREGAATEINIDQPFGVEIGPDGALYICEVGQHRVRRLDLAKGHLATVAGSGQKGYAGDGGPATEAELNEPYEVRFDSRGNLHFVEMRNHVVRRIDAQTGRILTVAGTGKAGFGGDDGPAAAAQLRDPHSIAFDRDDRLYIADIGNHRIRRVDPRTGQIETIAGNGEKQLPQDGGQAQGQPILGPRALYIVGDDVWIALREGNSIWRLDLRDGTIHHVAGTGKKGFSGDGGPAREATFDGPKGIAANRFGRIVVADTENQAIREIDFRSGQIRTLAGGGNASDERSFAERKATSSLDRPHGVCLGPDGSVYIGDTNHHRIHKVTRPTWQDFTEPPAEFAGQFGPYRSQLTFADGTPVKTPEDWARRRQEILATWQKRLGAWPPLVERPKVERLETVERDGYVEHHVHVQVSPEGKLADGYLLVPEGNGPFPAVLVPFYEPLTCIGRGQKGRGTHDYGWQLVQRGFVTLSIGTPAALESLGGDTRKLLVESGVRERRQPLTMLAYVAANCHTALAQMPQVDPKRIGIVGLSYGGKWSMFASCLYDKFACAVWSDPGIVFNEQNSNVNYWEPWYLGYDPAVERKPGIPSADNPRTGLYKEMIEAGEDLVDLHALMAPRPLLVSGGTEDPPQNWRALNHLVAVNKLLGHENRVALTSRSGHIPTPAALAIEMAFLEYWLK
ncbi:MAG TPA: prolyl oligopeptidase family serine peptidase [Pirellulales bacterium]|nr:prolyl oligopeptidase family serine peptidase [Pirellulales bacterium]